MTDKIKNSKKAGLLLGVYEDNRYVIDTYEDLVINCHAVFDLSPN